MCWIRADKWRANCVTDLLIKFHSQLWDRTQRPSETPSKGRCDHCVLDCELSDCRAACLALQREIGSEKEQASDWNFCWSLVYAEAMKHISRITERIAMFSKSTLETRSRAIHPSCFSIFSLCLRFDWHSSMSSICSSLFFCKHIITCVYNCLFMKQLLLITLKSDGNKRIRPNDLVLIWWLWIRKARMEKLEQGFKGFSDDH